MHLYYIYTLYIYTFYCKKTHKNLHTSIIFRIFAPFLETMKIIRLVLCLLAVVSSLPFYGATYRGRVVDDKGDPVVYATVYPEIMPEVGTATNMDGSFSFEANLMPDSKVIVSFIGYAKIRMNAAPLKAEGDSLVTITLHEQPIALEEMVISAKPSKQRNKRKQMASLLQAVHEQLERDFSDANARYKVVSDVRMQSDGATWGMEQLIADIVVQPHKGHEGRDSVQLKGLYCKRFFDARKRSEADSMLATEAIERMEKGSKQKFMRKAINAVDSGVIVHRTLFALGNIRYDFEKAMGDLRHWSVSNESEGETVLTHTEKTSKYLGCFQVVIQRHYILDSYTYTVLRFSEHADVKITIPFGVKLNADQLQMLNIINMNEQQISKFRLKKMRGSIDYNTLYQRQDGHLYIQEKNMLTHAFIIGSKKAEIPIVIKATQRVTSLKTQDVQPLQRSQMTRRIQREIVEIY